MRNSSDPETTMSALFIAPRARGSVSLRSTGGLPGRSGVGRVELREPGVVAPDIIVVGGEVERLLVLDERPSELPARLERDGQVVVRPRVVRISGDRLLESEGGLPPEPLPGDTGAEGDL